MKIVEDPGTQTGISAYGVTTGAGERLLHLDILRAIAILEVVMLHTAAPILYRYAEIKHGFWGIGNFVDSSVRSCVPLFVMLSGALVLNPDKDESIGVFLTKRFKKILVPLLIWSIIYYLWDGYNTPRHLSIKDFLLKFATDGIFYHFWFMYMLAGLYIAAPIFKIFLKSARKNELEYLLSIWVVFTVLTTSLKYLFGFETALRVEPVAGYIGYFLLGYYLEKYQPRAEFSFLILLLFLSMLVTFYGTYVYTRRMGSFNDIFYTYISFNVAVMAVTKFLIIKKIKWRTVFRDLKIFRVVMALSSASFGIYLIHALVLVELSDQLGINGLYINPFLGIPLTVIATVVISFMIISILKKIPFLKIAIP